MKEGIKQKLDQIIIAFIQKYPTLEQRKKLSYQLGIDEAGRGPVFGPMIYSGLWWPEQLKQSLIKLGFDDSKQLSQQKRQTLFQQIKYLSEKVLFFQTKQLTAQYISNCMLAQPVKNLNTISHQSALSIIRSALVQGFKVKNVFVDTVGDPTKYKDYLWKNLPYFSCLQNIVVTAKADSLHKVVSASSICAKVTRDKILNNWKFVQGLQFQGQLGSGYTSDPKTQAWLQNNKHPVFGYPNIVRFSWATVPTALKDCNVIQSKKTKQNQQYPGISYFKYRKGSQKNKSIFDHFKQYKQKHVY